jgi:hypothetical protein
VPLVRDVTPGSCIDIHTYFVARACVAVTRHDGELLEWDIATI